MKLPERRVLIALLASLWMLTSCKEEGRETPPPKPPRVTPAAPLPATTRSVTTTVPFGTDVHSGMMVPPGHPPVGEGAGSVTTAPAAGKPLQFTAPVTWKAEPPASSLRVAQYRIPRAAGDPQDGLVVVSTFPEMRGMTQMNIERWIEQFGQPDGQPSRERANVTTITVNGMPATVLRITGTYEGHPGWAMCAADIEAPDGPWFVKMTGPEKTIQENDAAFEAFVKSARQ